MTEHFRHEQLAQQHLLARAVRFGKVQRQPPQVAVHQLAAGVIRPGAGSRQPHGLELGARLERRPSGHLRRGQRLHTREIERASDLGPGNRGAQFAGKCRILCLNCLHADARSEDLRDGGVELGFAGALAIGRHDRRAAGLAAGFVPAPDQPRQADHQQDDEEPADDPRHDPGVPRRGPPVVPRGDALRVKVALELGIAFADAVEQLEDVDALDPQAIPDACAPWPRKLDPRLVQGVIGPLHLFVEPHPLQPLVEKAQRPALLDAPGFIEPVEGLGGRFDERRRTRPGAREQIGERPVDRVVLGKVGLLGTGGQDGEGFEALFHLGEGHHRLARLAIGVENGKEPLPCRLGLRLRLAARAVRCRGGEGGVVIGGRRQVLPLAVILVVEPVVIRGCLILAEAAEAKVILAIALPVPLRLRGKPQCLIARAAQLGIAGNVLVDIGRPQRIGIGPADHARIAGGIDPQPVPGEAAAAHKGECASVSSSSRASPSRASAMIRGSCFSSAPLNSVSAIPITSRTWPVKPS